MEMFLSTIKKVIFFLDYEKLLFISIILIYTYILLLIIFEFKT